MHLPATASVSSPSEASQPASNFIGYLQVRAKLLKRLQGRIRSLPVPRELSETDEASLTGNSIYDVSNSDGAIPHGQSLKRVASAREKVIVGTVVVVAILAFLAFLWFYLSPIFRDRAKSLARSRACATQQRTEYRSKEPWQGSEKTQSFWRTTTFGSPVGLHSTNTTFSDESYVAYVNSNRGDVEKDPLARSTVAAATLPPQTQAQAFAQHVPHDSATSLSGIPSIPFSVAGVNTASGFCITNSNSNTSNVTPSTTWHNIRLDSGPTSPDHVRSTEGQRRNSYAVTNINGDKSELPDVYSAVASNASVCPRAAPAFTSQIQSRKDDADASLTWHTDATPHPPSRLAQAVTVDRYPGRIPPGVFEDLHL